MKGKILTIIAFIIILSCVVSAYDKSYSTADSTNYNVNPNTNLGTQNYTYVQSRQPINQKWHAFYQFNLVNLTGGASTVNVTFRNVLSGGLSAGSFFNYYYCDDPYINETGITWNNEDVQVKNCTLIESIEGNNARLAPGTWLKLNITNNVALDADKKFSVKMNATSPSDGNIAHYIEYCTRESIFLNCRPYTEWSAGLTVSLVYPTTGQHFNYYNGTITILSSDSAKCDLNNTNWVKNSTQPSINFKFQNNALPLAENFYKIKANCSSSVFGIKKNMTFNFTIDRTLPDIFYVSPINKTTHNINFSLIVKYYDVWLYGTNTTIIRQSDGKELWSRVNKTMTGAKVWDNVSKSIILNTSYTDGNYSIIMKAADTHTKQIWDKKIIESNTNSNLNTKEGIKNLKKLKLTIENDDIEIFYPKNMDITTRKGIDRIRFEHKSNKELGFIKIYIKAKEIIFLPDSIYKGHLIIDDKYWFDAEGLPSVIVENESKSLFSISFNHNNISLISDSLGGLNQRNTTTWFFIHRTKPSILNNVTTIYASRTYIKANISESVTYNATLMLSNCTGTHTQTMINSTPVMIHKTEWFGLNPKTTYCARYQFIDYANNSKFYNFIFNTTTIDVSTNYAIVQIVPPNTVNFRCEGTESSGKNLIYGYNVLRNNISISSDNLKGTRIFKYYNSSTNSSFNVINAQYAFDNNSVTFTNFSSLGNYSSVFFNISKYIRTKNNLYNISLKFDVQNYGDSALRFYCGNSPINKYSVSSLITTVSKTGRKNFTLILSNSSYHSCLNVSIDNLFINIVAFNNSHNSRLYEINPLIETINFNVPSGTNKVMYSIPNPINGIYNFNCTAYNGEFWGEEKNATPIRLPSIILSIYDEMTGIKINDTVNINFVSDNPIHRQNYIYNITTGTKLIDNLDVIDYNILYDSPGYTKRHYFLGTSDFSVNGTFNLFLLKTNISGYSIVQVIDQNLQPLEGVLVRVMKSMPNFEDKQIISILKTNFEGEATLDFHKYTDDYQFIVLQNNKIIKISAVTQVSKDIIQIQIQLTNDKLKSIALETNTTGITAIYNSSSPFYHKSCIFAWNGLQILSGCAQVVERNLLSNDKQLCSFCANGNSGVASCDFNISSSSQYFCNGIIETNTTGSWFTISQKTFQYMKNATPFGLIGLFVAWIIFLAMSLLFKETPSLSILAGTISLIASGFMSLINIPLSGLMIICCIAGFFIMRLRG